MHRQQWGSGIASKLGKLAQTAIPLLVSEAKLAKPHLMKAAKSIAKDVTKYVAEEPTTRLFKRKAKHTQVRRRQRTKSEICFIKKSLIHERFCKCSLLPLEWFQILLAQTAVEKTSDVEYQSLTAFKNNAPVQFYIPPSTDDYYDLKNTKLFFSFRIKRVNGTNCDGGNLVAPINDIFNALWGNVELFMNDRLIS